jgi:hypothetical protein
MRRTSCIVWRIATRRAIRPRLKETWLGGVATRKVPYSTGAVIWRGKRLRSGDTHLLIKIDKAFGARTTIKVAECLNSSIHGHWEVTQCLRSTMSLLAFKAHSSPPKLHEQSSAKYPVAHLELSSSHNPQRTRACHKDTIAPRNVAERPQPTNTLQPHQHEVMHTLKIV